MSHFPIVQEPDQIASRRVVAIGVGSLVLFVLGVIATGLFLRQSAGTLEPRGEARVTPEIGQSEIGIVNQTPFGLVGKSDLQKAPQRERLEHYGWVDRQRGIVHIPIERAMELTVQGGTQPVPLPGERHIMSEHPQTQAQPGPVPP